MSAHYQNSFLVMTRRNLWEKTFFDFMREEDAVRFKSTLQQIGKNKEPFNNLERTTLHKNGNPVILETNGLPILVRE